MARTVARWHGRFHKMYIPRFPMQKHVLAPISQNRGRLGEIWLSRAPEVHPNITQHETAGPKLTCTAVLIERVMPQLQAIYYSNGSYGP